VPSDDLLENDNDFRQLIGKMAFRKKCLVGDIFDYEIRISLTIWYYYKFIVFQY
jgi:hypothetical protein